MRRAIILLIGIALTAGGSGLYAQTAPATAAPKPAAKASKPAAKSAKTSSPKAASSAPAASLRLDGIVKAPNGMIAVVTNPQGRTYFLREGDQLYDGRVEKIAMDGVSFHELGKDAFGKPVERQVNKRIYSSAGEQQ